MEYRADTLMIPRADKELDHYVHLQENNQENYFHEEVVTVDILNVEERSFSEDLTVSIRS